MQNISKRANKRFQSWVQLLLFIGIVICINILASVFYTYFDLTEDKRFTLTEPSRNLLRNIDDVVYVKVLLDGEYPAGFKRLQNSVREILDDFRSESGFIEYEFEDPGSGSVKEANARREELRKDGILPRNLRLPGPDGITDKLIYPYAQFFYKGRNIPVNFLEAQTPGVSDEVVLNNSVSLLEYKFANAIQKLKAERKPIILFTAGQGELEPIQMADLEKSLRPFYEVGHIHLDSIYQIPAEEVKVLIVAKPRGAFSDKKKFILDQYIMNGGKVLWLIDRLNVNLDSMRTHAQFIPGDFPLNLEDQFFKYGFRVEPNLILDLQCSRIPLRVGQQGNMPQYDLFEWYYHPVISSNSDHPIVKNLDNVNLFFPNSVDTIRTKTEVRKTILLQSSEYSRIQYSPVRLDFEILRYDPQPEKFNKPFQNVAVLLEGVFPSLYENRATENMAEGMKELGVELRTESVPTKMMVVSDGDIIRNLVDPKTKGVRPLGLNPWEGKTYANKDFLINTIEYLIDDKGLIQARGKEVKLRLLNKVKAKDERTKWQLINILLPIVFLIIFGLSFNWIRRRRFAS
ncbi:MAG: gliding motility-associated ABC transporter substrate-binding protein GldG [Bacteroidetes bacterium]|nr:gliding motility-associated ABC transporter substrate-binding protein GldG [Bacteroidota bacterium]